MGLTYRLQDDDIEFSETLFFYPLIAQLYELSKKLGNRELNDFS